MEWIRLDLGWACYVRRGAHVIEIALTERLLTS